MSQKAISEQAIEKATGTSWPQWLERLEKIGARNMSHKEIARLLYDKGYIKKGKDWPANRSFNAGWWAQMLTVTYEQHIGRRVPGQTCDGDFAAAVSKTLPGTMDEALEWWLEKVKNRKEFHDVAIEKTSVSKTEKWRYWRAKLADGSLVSVHFSNKPGNKANLGLQHEKLETQEQVDEWKRFWKELFVSS